VSALDNHGWIARESEAFAAVIEAGGLERRVPGCPAWTRRDLAWHLGRVQQFWARTVRVGADVNPVFSSDAEGPTDAAALAAWIRAATTDLLDALRATPPGTPAWTWWLDDRTAGAIARHQVQEAAVHRWDAQSASGTPEALAHEVADDGVDEFVWIARQLRDPARITFVATDSGRSTPTSGEPPVATVRGTASDLVLLLYGRVSVDEVDVDGDRAALDAFLSPIE